VRHPTPLSSFTLLVLHTERKLTLSEKDFDHHWDQVTDALERANNERYRLTDQTHYAPTEDFT